ncbi:GGDEF domain-containing protein [Nocardia altamirensis]|uniref:GGDEF domain-containing protein n=1 Tax=Nocardia altamirensis TaxID=472158 RepID=UPI000A072825|nr:GGDEF domain-containing protein [Nocardia altamirensis]
MTDMRSTFQSWWRDRVDYRWLIETFESRSALVPMKIMVGSGGIVMVSIVLLALASNSGQSGTLGVTQAITTAALAAVWGLRWWLGPWPGERESLMWIAVVDVAVLANNIMVTDRLLGALGIVLLVSTGGYVTIFHGPRILALHVGFSVFSILLVAVLMVIGWPGHNPHATGDIALGAGVVMANFVVAAVVLPAVQFSHWLMRLDALSDPLTMLLNRRGLESHLSHYSCTDADNELFVVLVDLDQFKTVNDTIGHSVGDDVLVRTADCLRATAPASTVIARTGGDEFVVFGCLRGEKVGVVAEQLRAAVESIPDMPTVITASVGAAVFDPARDLAPDAGSTFCHVFRRADRAMYRAKQLGGNAVVVAWATMRDESVAANHCTTVVREVRFPHFPATQGVTSTEVR